MWAGLAGILIVAALLRLFGLSWGLRHVPDHDEVVFVEATRAMIRAGDLDHRFYEYPGLFVYLLAPVLTFFPSQGAVDPAGFLAARLVIAAFSVVSVALVFFLARRLAGAAAGILAAALMAAAPIEVWTMHMIRSDVVLEAFVLASLLWFQYMGDRSRDDVWSGVAVGLTAAIKFTGVLIAPAYVAARCVRPGARWRSLVLAGGVSALAWLAVTPYALIRPSAYLGGVWTQTDYFYGGTSVAPHFFAFLDFYVRAIIKGLSAPPGEGVNLSVAMPVLACALLGLVVARRAWRAWLPLVVYPAVLIAVLSTAEERLARLALSCVGPFVVLAGVGLAAPLRRSRALGGVLAALVVAMPLWHSVEVARMFARPSTLDRTLDWIEAQVPRGARILSAVPSLGIDGRRYEVVYAQGLAAAECPWALGMDWVVRAANPLAGWCAGLRSVAIIGDVEPGQGPRIEILTPVAVAWRPVTARPEWLRASVSQQHVSALVDGDPRSVWRTPGPQEAGTWIEVAFPQAQRIDRIELVSGARRQFARRIHILVRETGGAWRRPPAFPGRPPLRDLPEDAAPPSQVSLLHVERVSDLRIVLLSGARQPWSIAELKIAARVAPAGEAVR